MGRRRGQRRQIYTEVPTCDGRKVAVRSRTIAERLFAQQQSIQEQTRASAKLREQRDEARKQLAQLTGQPLVRMLLRVRLISLLIPGQPAVYRGGGVKPTGEMPSSPGPKTGTNFAMAAAGEPAEAQR